MSRSLLAIARFDLRFYLGRISTWVYFGIFFAVGFLIMCAIGGAFASANLAIGGSGGNVFVNSPRSLLLQVMVVSLFGLIVTAALLGNAVYRDFEARVHPLFFTTPLGKIDYLGGRFLGAFLANLIVFLAIPLGLLAASVMPFLDAERIAPVRLTAYFQPLLIGVLPNLLLTGALFFTLATLTRQMLANHVGGVVLLVGYLLASTAGDLDDQRLAAYLDPFGMATIDYATRYWTPAEQNLLLLPFEGVVLWNRLLWLTVAGMILAFGFWRFRYAQALEERERKEKPDTAAGERSGGALLPEVSPRHDFAAQLLQYRTIVATSFRGVVFNRYFLAILVSGLTFLVLGADQVGMLYGTKTWPLTYTVLEVLGGLFSLFVVIIITFYGGELVWRERDHGLDQVLDSAPVPSWVPYAAKLTALFAVVAALQLILLLAGIATQAMKRYYDFEIGQYLVTLFGLDLVDYFLLCVLITLIHVLVDHKYLGHLVAILYFLATLFADQLGFEHNLYTFGSDAGRIYSDMNGYGPFIIPFLWFKAYWAVWALLLAVGTRLFWVRGRERSFRSRLGRARARLSRATLAASATALLLIVVLGGFIFYNTNVLNDYSTSLQEERSRAEYERLYKRFEDLPQPRIAAVALEVDLFPDRREVRVRGAYRLENRSGVSIDSLHLRIPSTARVGVLEVEGDSRRILGDEERGYHILALARPLLPGDSLRLDFELAYLSPGFENRVSNLRIVENGTFLASDMMPRVGYAAESELLDDEVRRKHQLAPRERMPSPDDLVALTKNLLSADADWIEFEATISTAPDQIAIAPGTLQREWQTEERRYFSYRMDAPILAFYTILSGRYQVQRERWGNVEIEIYHHPDHRFNLGRMVDAVQKSLEYFTSHFGPYPHDYLRIVEFPRYQAYAQAFPGTIPYSEGIGFIARVEDPEVDIDYPFYVTAHEVAHQWWGHQVVGAAAQGATFLVETLAQYSALMVMEQEYGSEQLQRFLRYELDRYLAGRAFERKKEMPLLRVENQSYIHYNKGALVMYALRDYLGEARLNGALREFLEENGDPAPPYATAPGLLRHLEQVTPDSLTYLLRDMLEEITLYENRVHSATSTELGDGRFRVELVIDAMKVRADSLGNEIPIEMDDRIEIGVFGLADEGARRGPLLYLEKHRIRSGMQTITIEVDGAPARAGIDPLYKLIDRRPGDNLVALRPAG